MSNEIDLGKEWITKKIDALAEEIGEKAERKEWVGADFTYHFLEIIVAGQLRKKKFTEEDLEDLLGDQEVQKKITKSLREIFEPLKKDQIGFNPR